MEAELDKFAWTVETRKAETESERCHFNDSGDRKITLKKIFRKQLAKTRDGRNMGSSIFTV